MLCCVYKMSEDLLLKYKLADADIEAAAHNMHIRGMSGALVVGMLADTGIRDDLIRMHMLLGSDRNESHMLNAVRDCVLIKRITFAPTTFTDTIPASNTFARKLSSALDDNFIVRKCKDYKLSQPYKYALLVLICVSGKLTKRLVRLANESIIKLGGHQISYIKSKKYTDVELDKSEKSLLGTLKTIFASMFAALQKIEDKQMPRTGICAVEVPDYTAQPVDRVPTTARESVDVIEEFLIKNREVFRQIEQYYIAKTRQIDHITATVIDVYRVYFGLEEASAVFLDCI